jgi:hypothetical protein
MNQNDIALLIDAGLDLDELFERFEWSVIREIHYCVIDSSRPGPDRMAGGCVRVERAEAAGIVGFRWYSADDLGDEQCSQVSADEAAIHEQAESHARREDSCETYDDLLSDIISSGFFPEGVAVDALLERMTDSAGCVLLRPSEWDDPQVVPMYHVMTVPHIRVVCRYTQYDNAKELRDEILKYQREQVR